MDRIIDHLKTYHGALANTAGDAVLAVFESVLDAVSCLVAIQDELLRTSFGVMVNRRVPAFFV